MSAKTTALCPCQSSLSYEDCCGRFHSGNMFPETAEQLMRSRYSAFVLKNIPYIVQTTVPSQQPLLDEKALQDWADETQWLGLDIVKAEALTKTQSAVEFLKILLLESLPARRLAGYLSRQFRQLQLDLMPKQGLFL